MDQARGSSNGGYGPRPPPYSPHYDGPSSYTGMSYEVSPNIKTFLSASWEKREWGTEPATCLFLIHFDLITISVSQTHTLPAFDHHKMFLKHCLPIWLLRDDWFLFINAPQEDDAAQESWFLLKSRIELAVLLLVWTSQVGKENVAVVSPPVTYDNMVHPVNVAAAGGEQQYGQAPPDYSQGLEESAFSDAAIRRGEGWKERGVGGGDEQRAWEAHMFLVCTVRAENGSAIFTPSFALQCFLEIDFKLKIVSWSPPYPASALHLPRNTNHFKWEDEMWVWWKQNHLQTAFCSINSPTCLSASLWQSSQWWLLSVFLPSLYLSMSLRLSFCSGFIRKVCLTLMLQLLVTIGIICTFLYWWGTNTQGNYIQKRLIHVRKPSIYPHLV